MKKFLSLLALVLMSCMGAWAFEVSDAPENGTWAANTRWYLIQNKKGGYVSSNYLSSDNLLLNNSTLPHLVYGMWCFVGDESNGYKLYNRAKGTNFTLQWNGDKNGSEGGNARFQMVENAESNNTFDISNSQKSGYNCVKMHGSTNDYWNLRDNFLSFWCNNASTNDDGSAFEFKAINDFVADAETTYTLQLVGTNVYLNAKAGTDASSNASLQSALEGFLITGTKGAYTLEGKTNQSKIGHNHAWNVTNTTETWEIVSVENMEGYYIFRGDKGEMLGPNSGVTTANAPVYTNHTRNVAWTIAADETTYTDVTYVLNNAFDEEISVVVNNVAVGQMAPAPVIDYFTFDSFSDENCTVSDGNKTFHVTGTWSFPFQEGKFYQIKNVNQQYLKNVDASNITTKNPANNNAADMLWYFKHVANTQNQYTIHSVSTETAWSGTSGKMKLAAKGTPFQILKKDANFNIFSGNPNGYVGAHEKYNNDANSAVGYWTYGSASEAGSQWTVLEFDESALAALNLINGDEGYVGTFIGETSAALTAANTYMSSKTAANLKAALEACSGDVERITIDPNKFYQLISQDGNTNGGRVVYSPAYCSTTGTSSNYGDRNIKLGTVGSAATTCTSALKFIPNGEGYTIQHVNSNYYFVRLGAFNDLTNPDLPISTGGAGKYLLHNVSGQPSDIWVLNNADASDHYLHCGYEGDGVNTLVIVTTTPDSNNGLRWKIKEITEVPITIGSVGYTTVCFPMAVTIPDGVIAYKVTEETSDKMMLAEVTGDVAAKTPLILEKNGGGQVVFPVVASGETVTGNMLAGSTARRVGFAANSFYALAADSEAALGVSFKINGSVNAIPANKAYLPVSTGSSNKALYFDFGGETLTGIDTVEALPATDALYNINGQRVVAPTRGIYVKANGQKVFIK